MVARSEMIIRREDGSRVKLVSNLWVSCAEINWDTSVYICKKGKRSWFSVYSGDDYQYRKLSMDERANFVHKRQLNYVTREEILASRIKLWEEIKPHVELTEGVTS